MVDLDSDPTKLIEIVEIGKQLLITRGALTTFSVANDVAKYFAILPAMFVVAFPQLDVLNVMRLSSPQSAILSAVVFNALVIVALIPLALRGVRVPTGRRPRSCCAATSWSTGWAAWSRRSSASSSSTWSSPSSPESEAVMESLFTLGRHTLAGLRVLLVLTSCSASPTRSPSPASPQVAFALAGVRLARHRRRAAAPRRTTTPSAPRSSARRSTVRSGSTRARPPPATATTRSPPPAPTSAPRTPTWSRRSRSGGRPSPRRRASTRPTSRRRTHRVGLRPGPAHLARRTRHSRCRAWRGSTGSSEDEVRDLVDDHTDGRTSASSASPG